MWSRMLVSIIHILYFAAATLASTCPTPTDVGNSSTIWTTAVADTTVFKCQNFSWIASRNGSALFAMRFRNDPYSWYVDDVSILSGSTEMLVNGGFETGSLSPWVRTEPNGTCNGTKATVRNSSGVARTGNYGLWDGSNGCFDQVTQNFSVATGRQYLISFWLKSTNTSTNGIFASFSIV